MEVIHDKQELEQFLGNIHGSKTVGFVPTMGALHEGHISLIEKAAGKDDIVICSIFVNPAQFNESSDYNKYPKVLDADLALLNTVKTDVVFAPTVLDIYPDGTQKIPHYEIGEMDFILEGEHRPGHFQGVCHIIDIFLNMIQPNHIYMGEKDFQQIAVVQRLIKLKNHTTQLIACPTLREKSGLAMSSRNRLLSEDGLAKGATFYKALCYIRDHATTQSFSTLKKEAEKMLNAQDFIPEYIALCDANTMAELKDFDAAKDMRLIAAAFLERVRLIDNIAL